jgi:serine/threonine-protein kinase
MNPEDTARNDDRFLDLLVAVDEAVAAGDTPDPAALAAETPRLSRQLKSAQACLRRLEDDRRRGLSLPQYYASTLDETTLAFSSNGDLLKLGRFRVQSELGRGGCGIVYRAFDPLLRRDVALKVPRPDALGTLELRRRFLREARVVAGLDHPNVVPVHEVGEAGPFCYLVSTYCQGMSLAAWLKEQRVRVVPEIAATVVAILAEAVHYLHRCGILHRDLKPSNVLVDGDRWTVDGKDGRVSLSTGHGRPPTIKITDFGLAKWMEGQGSETQTGMVLGTPRYMAPEQAAGNVRAIGPATDVYSLGVILYEMLTGRTPFEAEAGAHLLKQIESQEPPPPRRWRPELPRDLEAVCLKCLEKDPRRRYQSAQELADDLGRWRRAEQPQARRLLARIRRSVRRHALTALVGLLMILVATAASLNSYYRDPKRQLECIQHQLANGNPVELIGAAGPPSWYQVRLGKTDTAIWADPDKPFTLHSPDIFLVELLRDPPVRAYRFRAQIRHESFLATEDPARGFGVVGIYFLYCGEQTDPGQHWFATLIFNNLTNDGLPEGNRVQFEFCHVLGPAGGPWAKERGRPDQDPPLASFAPSGHPAWRQLTVEVTPKEVVLQWEKKPARAFTYQELGEVADSIQLRQAKKKLGVIPPTLGPRTAVGLFVCSGTAAFRNVVVEPLDRD